MKMTTLCYIEKDGQYLMLHRTKKEKDINKDKWIGVGGHAEGTESPEECLLREVKEETGLFIIPEKAVGLGEILEVRKDIFDDTKKFICHSLFYYCEETGEETPIHLTKSEIAKGYYLKWATPQEIYDTNIAMEKDPWIIRDTAFIKMILDGKIAALHGIL